MTDIHEIERTRDSVQKHWSKMLFTFGALSLHVAVCGMGWRDRLVVDYLLSSNLAISSCRETREITTRARRSMAGGEPMPCRSVPVGAGKGSDTLQEGSTSGRCRIGIKRRWISVRGNEMTRNLFRVLFIVVLIAVIVSVDLLFLRHHVVTRLIVNIGIVVVFSTVYFISFKKS